MQLSGEKGKVVRVMKKDVEFWRRVEARRSAYEDKIKINQPPKGKKVKPVADGATRAEVEEERERLIRRNQFLQWAAIGQYDEPYRSRAEARERRRIANVCPQIYRDIEEAIQVGDRWLLWIAHKALANLRAGLFRPQASEHEHNSQVGRIAGRICIRRSKTRTARRGQ